MGLVELSLSSSSSSSSSTRSDTNGDASRRRSHHHPTSSSRWASGIFIFVAGVLVGQNFKGSFSILSSSSSSSWRMDTLPFPAKSTSDDDNNALPTSSSERDLNQILRLLGNHTAHNIPQTEHDDSNNEMQKKRQNLFIHVGPSKTGTTTIQKQSVHLDRTGILKQDHYTYFGRYMGKRNNPIKNFHQLFGSKCLLEYHDWKNHSSTSSSLSSFIVGRKPAPNEPVCIEKLKRGLTFALQNNISLVMSDEAWSYSNNFQFRREKSQLSIQAWRDLVLKDWNVTIVIGYRRFGEWMFSAIRQANDNRVLSEPNVNRWPQEGGAACFHTWEILRRYLIVNEGDEYGHAGSYRYVDHSVHVWNTSLGLPVALLDMHSKEKDIMEQLYCDIMEDAPFTCDHLRQRQVHGRENQLASYTSEFSTVVYRAAELDLIDEAMRKTTTRDEAAREFGRVLMQVHNRSFTDLPLLCPPRDRLEALLELSIQKELKLFGRVSDDHEATFRHLVYVDRVACQVDMERLFSGKQTWQEVLDSLGPDHDDDGTTRDDWSMIEGIRLDQIGRRMHKSEPRQQMRRKKVTR